MVSAANDTGYENLNADSDQDHASQDGCSPCKAGMVAKHGQNRVGGADIKAAPTSHTTVRTVRYTAVSKFTP